MSLSLIPGRACRKSVGPEKLRAARAAVEGDVYRTTRGPLRHDALKEIKDEAVNSQGHDLCPDAQYLLPPNRQIG